MNLYHLRYFVTLAHLEHYTKAAEILAITQPSLSHAIASLEKELGVKLFEKEGRNVVLTKCGQAQQHHRPRLRKRIPGFQAGQEYRLPFSWLHRYVYRHDPGPERPERRRCLLFHAGS